MKIKTIDVNFKEWFDNTWGNSYNAGNVTVNFGMKNQKSFNCSYEYGYGDYYLQRAAEVLNKEKLTDIAPLTPLWRYCDDHNIILRHNIIRGCKKKELLKY